MKIAIVGATGNVGRKIIEVLERKKLSIEKLYLLASQKSVGKELMYNGNKIKVENLEDFDFSKSDITFFSAGKKISEVYAPVFREKAIIAHQNGSFKITQK